MRRYPIRNGGTGFSWPDRLTSSVYPWSAYPVCERVPYPLIEPKRERHRTIATTVGLIANPASARDIRRLVADGAAVTTNDKLNLISRVLAGLASVGVDRVLSMQDASGLSGGLVRRMARTTARGWPSVEFIDHLVSKGPADTRRAVQAMVREEVGAIVVIGGDGTNQLVAADCGDIPLLPLSTGTNNAFPQPAEPTVAGIVAGLVASGRLDPADAARRCKRLVIEHHGILDHALVDVAIVHTDGLGAGAVWDPRTLSELFLSVAEPDGIGLSAIGAHLRWVSRDDADGLHIRLGQPAKARVRAPIAPGRVVDVDVASFESLHPGQTVTVSAPSGVVAIDGERAFTFGPDAVPRVTLTPDGPLVIDVARAMRHAAITGLLADPAERSGPNTNHPPDHQPRST